VNSEFSTTLPAGENATRFEVTFKNFDVLSNNTALSADALTLYQTIKTPMLNYC